MNEGNTEKRGNIILWLKQHKESIKKIGTGIGIIAAIGVLNVLFHEEDSKFDEWLETASDDDLSDCTYICLRGCSGRFQFRIIRFG